MRGTVIPFAGRVSRIGLTLRDRMEIALWQAKLRHLGCERVVIHERLPGDPPELESFLSIYLEGEGFAKWGVARKGSQVLAWHSATGADIGRFETMEEALLAIFPEAPHGAWEKQEGEVIRAFC